MKHAPFLLQAFAARVLASGNEVTVSREDLEQQGYDVETLVEMIEEYGRLPDSQRGFNVRVTSNKIWMQRKVGTPAPQHPEISPLKPR